MGCDIHTYLEYATWTKQDGAPYWVSWGGRNNLGRDYQMFALLSDGVRGSYTHSRPAKGLPEGLAYETRADAFMCVTENDDWADSDGYCTVASARSWGNPGAKDGDYIDHPDWHSHSWLTPDEYAQVLGRYMTEFSGSPSIEYEVTLVLMRALEERGAQVRLVYWFDN